MTMNTYNPLLIKVSKIVRFMPKSYMLSVSYDGVTGVDKGFDSLARPPYKGLGKSDRKNGRKNKIRG